MAVNFKNYCNRFSSHRAWPPCYSQSPVTFWGIFLGYFPSGHSSRGWMFALALATVAPDRIEGLLSRAVDKHKKSRSDKERDFSIM